MNIPIKKLNLRAVCQKHFSLLVFFLLQTFSSLSFAAPYQIDPEHSRVEFKVKHMGITWVSGGFNEFSGQFNYNPQQLTASNVKAVISVSSIDSNATKRDKHLRSPDFLNSSGFKFIHFLSNKIEGEDPTNFKIKGVLTIRDVSKEVILDAHNSGTLVDPWGTTRTGFQASTVIKRSDFGLKWNRILESGALLVGDEVYINLEIQGVELKDNSPKLTDPSKKIPGPS